MIHVRFLSAATNDEAAARLGRLLAGVETEADRAALAPPPELTPAQARGGRMVRDPRTLPGWRPGYKQLGTGGERVTAGGGD